MGCVWQYFHISYKITYVSYCHHPHCMQYQVMNYIDIDEKSLCCSWNGVAGLHSSWTKVYPLYSVCHHQRYASGNETQCLFIGAVGGKKTWKFAVIQFHTAVIFNFQNNAELAVILVYPCVNPFWPCNAIYRFIYLSKLAYLMAPHPTTPGHYLNQCWIIIILSAFTVEQFTESAHEFDPLHVLEDYTFKNTTISLRGQWVNMSVSGRQPFLAWN